MWARAVAANLTGPAAAVAQRVIPENMSGEKAVKCSLLTGIYGVGSWEGVVEQEWDDSREKNSLYLKLSKNTKERT